MRIIITLLVASLLSLPSLASEQAKLLLMDMAAKARTSNYQGYFTYERGAQSRSFQVFHMVDAELEKQRLVFLDGKQLEIINDGHELSCVHPGERAIHREGVSAIGPDVDVNHSEIWKYYDAIFLDDDRIAGREAKRVYLKSRDNNRYSYVFAIDAENHVMLKMQMLDDSGRSLERFRFVTIDFDSVERVDIEPSNENEFQLVKHEHPAESSEPGAASLWNISWLPMGFVEESARVHSSHTQKIDEQHIFSDGLSAFSVFIEKTDLNTPQPAQKMQGGTVAVSHFLVSQGQQYRVTVVGEIPASSAQTIAQSVAVLQ